MQPMAERLGVDHRQLRQFVSSSTWGYSKVRERLARWAAVHISPDAYAIDDVGFPRGRLRLAGGARVYCGALGKCGGCQIAVRVNPVSDRASSAVDWRLFPPESWDDTEHGEDPLLAGAVRRRRAETGIPDTVRHREKWRLALDMLDEVRGDCQQSPRDSGHRSAAPRVRRGYGPELSPRERQVARLLATGATNQGIARALALSTRTAEHHVANTLKKLGVTRDRVADILGPL